MIESADRVASAIRAPSVSDGPDTDGDGVMDTRQCPDLDGDGDIDLADPGKLLAEYGEARP